MKFYACVEHPTTGAPRILAGTFSLFLRSASLYAMTANELFAKVTIVPLNLAVDQHVNTCPYDIADNEFVLYDVIRQCIVIDVVDFQLSEHEAFVAKKDEDIRHVLQIIRNTFSAMFGRYTATSDWLPFTSQSLSLHTNPPTESPRSKNWWRLWRRSTPCSAEAVLLLA